jgi:hypothetical protein
MVLGCGGRKLSAPEIDSSRLGYFVDIGDRES